MCLCVLVRFSMLISLCEVYFVSCEVHWIRQWIFFPADCFSCGCTKGKVRESAFWSLLVDGEQHDCWMGAKSRVRGGCGGGLAPPTTLIDY